MALRILKISLGVILIILGIVGILLPVMPGLILLFIGYAFIIDRRPKSLFKEVVNQVKKRYCK